MGKVNNVKRWNELFSKEHLYEHFQEKVKEKASVGLDKVTVFGFEKNVEQEIGIIQRKVKNGTYHFTRYRQVLFSKGAGKEPRIISVPTVRDKLVPRR
jgi:retron-type reverse transcriptase